MTKVIIILVLVIVFLVICVLLSNMFIKTKNSAKTQVKTETKTEEIKKDNSDEIPEVLKEVTMGNYMFENAKVSDEKQLEQSMVENSEIKKEEKIFRVELGEPLDDYDQPLNARDIIDQLDRELDEQYTKPKTKSVGSEINKMSPQLKAMLIANILEKKDKN